MNRVESLFARLFLMIVSFIFTMIVLEVAANYYLWNIASDEQFNRYASINQVRERYGNGFFVNKSDKLKPCYVPHHYIGYVPTANYTEGTNKHNSLGFRGEEISLEKPDGLYRIVALGESTTYGTEVESYRDAYPYLLQEYLHEQGYTNVEVINAGVGGYTSYENLMNLIFRVMELEPDLIISYQGLNDIHTRFIYPYEFYRGDNSGYRGVLLQSTSMPSIFEYSTAYRILAIMNGWSRSHSAVDWKFNLYSKNRYDGIYKDQYEDTGEEPGPLIHGVGAMEILENNPPIYFERNIRDFVSAAQNGHADVLMVTFATSTEFVKYTSSEAYQFGIAQHNDITRSIADELDTYLFDFAPIFPQDKKYYADGRHMTKEGNKLRAQMIGDYIIETNVLPALVLFKN